MTNEIRENKAYKASDEELATAKKDKHGVLYSRDGSRLLKCESKQLTEYTVRKGTKVICNGAFQYCDALTSIKLPKGLEAVGDDAFHGCASLRKADLRYGVTEVGEYAFAHCYSLESIILPNTITRISKRTFWNCGSLKEIALSDETIAIDEGAFCGCSGIGSICSDIMVPPQCDDDTFDDVDKEVCELYIPDGSEEAYASAGGWKGFKNVCLIG